MLKLELLLRLGGVLHFVLLCAGAMVPGVLNWRENLSRLNAFLRRLFWVYALFVFLMILAFGCLSLFHAEELAAGAPLARSVCAVIALCWIVRLVIQLFVFDTRQIVTGKLVMFGYHALTVIFVALVFIYSWAAVRAPSL
jgi:hypothetical protein